MFGILLKIYCLNVAIIIMEFVIVAHQIKLFMQKSSQISCNFNIK